VTVLLVANLAATVVRFALYRRWVFRHKAPPAASQPAPVLANPGLASTGLANPVPADLRLVPSTLLQREGTDR
jgi:hypothetical protein